MVGTPLCDVAVEVGAYAKSGLGRLRLSRPPARPTAESGGEPTHSAVSTTKSDPDRTSRRDIGATCHGDRGGTFEKSEPSPSAIVGCVRTASRSLEYGRS